MEKCDIVHAFEICDNNETGMRCGQCPYRSTDWNGAWEDDETNCWTELKKDVIKLLGGDT